MIHELFTVVSNKVKELFTEIFASPYYRLLLR